MPYSNTHKQEIDKSYIIYKSFHNNKYRLGSEKIKSFREINPTQHKHRTMI